MKLLLERKWKKATYTIGRLSINGTRFCDTLEDRDRGLKSFMSVEQIMAIKVASVTAIPAGTYRVDMNTVSPKYSTKPWFVRNCKGARMPRLENVPGYSGVLIHPGNTDKDSAGCILVGVNDKVGRLSQSCATFKTLFDRLYAAHQRGEAITITIQ